MCDELRTTLADGVMLVEINRPAKKNAVTLAMWRALADLAGRFAADREVRVVVMTGAGGSFSAGADISEFPTVRSTDLQVTAYEAAVDAGLAAISGLPQPTVAAIAGACFGGGVALAASTDFRVADVTAQFSVSAVRMGLAYNVAKCTRLSQLVGVSTAKRILLTGQRFDAEQARAWGFVDQVGPAQAIDAALDLARTLKQGAPLALSGMKQILEALAAGRVEAERAKLEDAIRAADLSEDHREAVRAFAERRKPEFVGR